MPPILAVLCCFAFYVAGYAFYARWLARRVFSLRPDVPTPAHALRDGVDYVPTRRWVLFGHHYASITGLSPMLGPAIAVIWGWVPALLWVVVGAILIGCVHDFGALVVSVRAKGRSIGGVAEGLMGRRAKSLLHALIFFGVSLAMGVFAFVIARLLTPEFYPQAVLPSVTILVVALVIARLVRASDVRRSCVAVTAGFMVTLASILLAARFDAGWGSVGGWIVVLLAYAWAASVLPVWSLLQPRDFLNSLLLYLGLGLTFAGFFLAAPRFAAPTFNPSPEGAPPLFPFVFIIIACGAASGFHSLVASGTTAKQLDRETDARLIGYGGMIGESLLGLVAVLACSAGFASSAAWNDHYTSWSALNSLGSQMGAFIDGAARFVAALGIGEGTARTLIAVMVVSFALTTLDSATRLLRYNIEEIGQSLGAAWLANRYVAASAAVASIALFAFHEIDGRPAGLALWRLFGSTNQLLAGLALLVVSLYLIERRRPSLPYVIPMLFLMLSTLSAMAYELHGYFAAGERLLLGVGACITAIALWLIVEAILALRRIRRACRVETLDIRL